MPWVQMFLCPAVVGGGARLFDDGLPPSAWSLTHQTASDTGAIYLTYDRIR